MVGIRGEVQQHLVKLREIGEHGPAARVDGLLDRNRAGQRAAKQLQGLRDHLLAAHRPALLLTVPAESQDLLHQLRRPFPAPHNLADAKRRLLGIIAFPGEFRKTENRAEDIVEIVRDAAGQGPYGLHLLRLAKLGFERRFERHIA